MIAKFSKDPRYPTAYEFACGAVQVRRYMTNDPTLAPDFQISLWKEHGTYHVRGHDFSTHTRAFWDSFATLKDARKRFNAAVRQYKAGI